MPELLPEEAKDLKAVIWDLHPKAAKQALLAMVNVLMESPSVRGLLFKAIIEDARRWPRDEK